jgi:hypothetical protein
MLVSIAISLKRIAETMHRQDQPDAYGLKGPASLANAIIVGPRDSR